MKIGFIANIINGYIIHCIKLFYLKLNYVWTATSCCRVHITVKQKRVNLDLSLYDFHISKIEASLLSTAISKDIRALSLQRNTR